MQSKNLLIICDAFSIDKIFATWCVIPVSLYNPDIVNSVSAFSLRYGREQEYQTRENAPNPSHPVR